MILVSRDLKQMQEQKARGILVIPHWPSASFWPLICSETGGFVKNIIDWIDLPILKEFYTPCRNGVGILETQDLKFRMLALDVNFRDM